GSRLVLETSFTAARTAALERRAARGARARARPAGGRRGNARAVRTHRRAALRRLHATRSRDVPPTVRSGRRCCAPQRALRGARRGVDGGRLAERARSAARAFVEAAVGGGAGAGTG